MKNLTRKSGILLQPTSLPSKYGIGDFGPEAYQFIDFLKDSGQSLWQILPLNPVGFGESPYMSYSAFAGNPLLISIDSLLEQGLLLEEDVTDLPSFNEDVIEFSLVKDFKESLLLKAFQRFKATGGMDKVEGYRDFYDANDSWLSDYCLFMALKDYFGGCAWNLWDKSIASRKTESVHKYAELLQDKIAYYSFTQFLFFEQWLQLKEYANNNGIKIIGDLPIFVSYDSSDVWVNSQLFELDPDGNPSMVAGVPPDYFSEFGQLWGNPLYRWGEMEKDDYQWWRSRFESILLYVDIIRLDHFRGFESYWEVPSREKTAVNGRWVKGPGAKFFKTVESYLGELPIIAEDLGIITSDVVKLREQCNFPGMKILQFMFETGPAEVFLSLFASNTVMYTGTHDNNTLWGWYKEALKGKPEVITRLDKYFQIRRDFIKEEICWRLIKMVMESNAFIVILPLQDILNLDTNSRMNYPGTSTGNWKWRFRKGCLTEDVIAQLGKLTIATGRRPHL